MSGTSRRPSRPDSRPTSRTRQRAASRALSRLERFGLLTLLVLCTVLAGAVAAPPADTPGEAAALVTDAEVEAAATEAGPTELPLPTPDEEPLPEDELLEEEWDLGPVSAAAQRTLDRVRGSVVQIRGFFGGNRSEAFHGSGFLVTEDGYVVTNYHVIARAAFDNWNYRLEYLTDDGSRGPLAIRAIDVEHDLAILRADGLRRPPARLQLKTPAQGDRAYAIGFPLNLGLVITEGIANGRLENTYSPRLHYAGAMNPGMSGGPALDSKGRVFGVNVAFSTRGQLVSFLVPAEFIADLLETANRSPMDSDDLRAEVAKQLRAHQAGVLAALPARFPTQRSAGYALPAELAPFIDCTATSGRAPSRSVGLQSVTCKATAELFVQSGLSTGDFRFSHQVLIGSDLAPLRFSEQMRKVAMAGQAAAGSAWHVTPYSCKSNTVILNGFRAGVQLCVRGYLLFEGLYDVAMVVVSRNREHQGFVSHLNLRGMEYAAAMDFTRRFLKAMRWNP